MEKTDQSCRIEQYRDLCEQTIIAILPNITALLINCNSACPPALAASTDHLTHMSVKSEPVRRAPDIKRAPNTRRSSTGIATLRLYNKASDLKSDSLFRRLLKSAVGADSPSSNPDTEKTAAALNLDVNETLSANLFRQNKFDLQQLGDIDKNNFVLGNLTHDNVIHLAKGNALFVPKKDIVVLADLAEIHIGAGSMVGVLRPNSDIVSIYDLEDSGSRKVNIKVGKESISLVPGKNLIISKEANEYEKLNPARRIAYRKLETKKLQSGFYAYTTEFSISSAVLHVKPLQKILLSDDSEDRKIANRLLKNYVILEDVFSNSEPFKMPATIVQPVKISSM